MSNFVAFCSVFLVFAAALFEVGYCVCNCQTYLGCLQQQKQSWETCHNVDQDVKNALSLIPQNQQQCVRFDLAAPTNQQPQPNVDTCISNVCNSPVPFSSSSNKNNGNNRHHSGSSELGHRQSNLPQAVTAYFTAVENCMKNRNSPISNQPGRKKRGAWIKYAQQQCTDGCDRQQRKSIEKQMHQCYRANNNLPSGNPAKYGHFRRK